MASRARAGSLKWQLDKSRTKLKAAVEETKEIRRAARSALSLQAEVARLRTLVSESAEGRMIALLREENARLKQQLRSAAPKGFERRLKLLDDEVADLPVSLRRSCGRRTGTATRTRRCAGNSTAGARRPGEWLKPGSARSGGCASALIGCARQPYGPPT